MTSQILSILLSNCFKAFVEHEAHDEEDDHDEAGAAHDHEEHEHHEDAHLKAVFKGLVVLSGIYMFFLVERLMKMYSNSKSNAKRRVRTCNLTPFTRLARREANHFLAGVLQK